MNKKLSQEKFPEFLNDKKIQTIIAIIMVFQLVMIVLGFIANIGIGLALLVIFIVVLFLLYDLVKKLAIENKKYISDLAFRIKRGEQEALIKMPIGILLFNENLQLQWINPYLQSHLGDRKSTRLNSSHWE